MTTVTCTCGDGGTHSAPCASMRICGTPNPAWLNLQARTGRIAALKVRNRWRFTDGQIQAALDTFSTIPRPADPNPWGLTRRGLARAQKAS